MSDIVVLTFDNATAAGEVREALRSLERGGELSLDDAAVVAKEPDGNVQVDDQLDRGVKIGAVGGGVLGLLLGFMFPLAGAAVGAAGGALAGRMADMGVDKGFVEDVTESLRPGTSALFLMVRGGNTDAAVAALAPYRGTLHQTSFGPDVEEGLRQALR